MSIAEFMLDEGINEDYTMDDWLRSRYPEEAGESGSRAGHGRAGSRSRRHGTGTSAHAGAGAGANSSDHARYGAPPGRDRSRSRSRRRQVVIDTSRRAGGRDSDYRRAAAGAGLSSRDDRERGGSGKFYAVRIGRHPGIFGSWEEAEEQVRGVSGAVHKACHSRAEAEAFLRQGGGEQARSGYGAAGEPPLEQREEERRRAKYVPEYWNR